MTHFGVGIVGMGWVAGEHMKAWTRNPHTEVVGCVSRTQEGALRKIQEVGISCPVYDSFEALLADPKIQIVSICSPPNLHVEHAIEAMKAGKHVCLEKPMALDLEGLAALRDTARATGVRSIVCLVLRWNPLFETIQHMLSQQSVGRVFYAEADYYHGIGPQYGQFSWNVKKNIGGSSLLSAGVHAVDALRWFVGAEATEVSALSLRGNGVPFDAYEYDPTEVFIVKFNNGTVGKVTSSLESKMPYVFNVLLLGTKGSIRNNQVWAQEELFPGQTDFVTIPTVSPDSGDVTHHPFQAEFDHFVDCILTGKESHCNIEDAVKSHEICFAADLSAARNGETVKLPLLT
jgi:predicted dehydrogenase